MPLSKMTNSTDETAIANLFSNDLVFGIPYFQRAYKWSDKNIERFKSDLYNLLDYEETSHFLGAIIVFEKATNPSEPNFYEVIDGQQRLTTCYLSLMALAKTYSAHGFNEEAKRLYKRFLVVSQKPVHGTNAKLICCKEDRAGMNRAFSDLTNDALLRNMIGSEQAYVTMHDDGSKDGRVWKNYKLLCKHFEAKYIQAESAEEGSGGKMLDELYAKLVNCMSLVQIVVKDPTDGPKIFDSLNSKQEPMTIGDLVRNELFAKYADRDDSEIDTLDANYWHPFYEKFKQNGNDDFDKVFEQYFFPYVLTQSHTVKKAEAFNYLRGEWAKYDDPVAIIKELSKYQDIFLDLYYGTSLTECPDNLKTNIGKLSKLGTPTSVYPFLMSVVNAVKENTLDCNTAVAIFERIESFLVRRVTCGYEPTGLHATFKALWNDCEGDYSVENVVSNIKRHNTVKWPDDEEFEECIKTRKLYKVKVTPFILSEWNKSLGGDCPALTSEQIEHILPENPESDSQWNKDWSKAEQEEKRDCLANFLPLSGSINASLQNADYDIKRTRYLSDSALKAPRDLAQKYATWKPEDFNDRASKLCVWALDRWKY